MMLIPIFFFKSSSVNLAGCFVFFSQEYLYMCIKKKKRIHNDHLDGSSHPYFPCFGSVYE